MIKVADPYCIVNRHRTALNQAMARVLDRGWFVLGPEVEQFEQAFAQYLGIGHCVSLASGTDALELALKSVGVVANGRVATVANAGGYTTGAVLAIGATPIFMDVDMHNQLVPLQEVQRVVAAGVDAIVVTHLYGRMVPDIAAIADFCANHGVPLIEDCAQAHGAEINGRKAGTFGAAGCFSFYPTKNLGALGDGGAVVIRSEDSATRLRSLRAYGWAAEQKYRVEIAGGRNSRLDELQAAILGVLLPALDQNNGERLRIAERYAQEIKHPEVTVPDPNGPGYVAHLSVIRCSNRDSLRHHLGEQGVLSDIHYPIPDHRQPVFGDTHAQLSLPNTEQLAAEILTLPCYPGLSEEQVSHVFEAVNCWCA